MLSLSVESKDKGSVFTSVSDSCVLDSLQDTAVGRPISINAFCGENESRDYIFTISVSKSFREEMDAAAVVPGSATLCFL